MNEPRRWRDDPAAPPELVGVLEDARRVRALDPELRARVGARVTRLSMLPVTAAAWFTVKTAAAIGVAAGVATASAVAVVEHQLDRPRTVPEVAPAPARALRTGPGVRPAPSHTARAEAVAAPSAEPEPSGGVTEPMRAPPLPSASEGLLDETRLLERARRALDARPEAALALSRDHARRFPGGALTRERELIQVEALTRLGRRNEARRLAERCLAERPDDLYAERLRRLLAALPAQ